MKPRLASSFAFVAPACVVAYAFACSQAMSCLTACNTAQLNGQSTSNACPTALAITCDAMAPGPGACSGDPSSAQPVVRQLPASEGFAAGCQATSMEPAQDQSGACVAASSCVCTNDPDAGVSWRCSP